MNAIKYVSNGKFVSINSHANVPFNEPHIMHYKILLMLFLKFKFPYNMTSKRRTLFVYTTIFRKHLSPHVVLCFTDLSSSSSALKSVSDTTIVLYMATWAVPYRLSCTEYMRHQPICKCEKKRGVCLFACAVN